MSDALTTEHLEAFREMKEEAAQLAPERGTHDMNAVLEVFRDGEPLLAIFCPNVDRDQLLDAAWFIVPIVEADRIIAVMDAHLARTTENPTTGQPWQQGEMQKACTEDMLCRSGVITDCLVINDVRRDGTYHMHSLTYHVDEAAKDAGEPVSVHWQREGDDVHHLGGDGERLEGLVPDALRRCFEQESKTELDALARGLNVAPKDAIAARDAAAITRLVIQGYGVALAGSDEDYLTTVTSLLGMFSEAIKTMESNNAE